MDIIDLRDIIIVGVPETLIILLTGVYISKGRIFYNNAKENIFLILRLAISCILLLLFTDLVFRRIFSSIVTITFLNSIVCICVFKFIMRFGLIESILSSFIATSAIETSEIFGLQVSEWLISFTTDGYMFKHIFIASLPPRILQIIILILLIKFNINLKNNKLVKNRFKDLSCCEKANIIVLSLIICLSNVILSNYLNLYYKLKTCNLEELFISSINLNIQLLFWTSVLFIIANTLFVVRTFKKYS